MEEQRRAERELVVDHWKGRKENNATGLKGGAYLSIRTESLKSPLLHNEWHSHDIAMTWPRNTWPFKLPHPAKETNPLTPDV